MCTPSADRLKIHAATSSFSISSLAVTRGFVYSSFLKLYNPRRSHSDVSMESQSSNESGYGGSSPVFSRQNSNSTLTFNHETATVGFSVAQPQSQSSPHPSLDSSSSSRRSHHRDAPNPNSTSSVSSSPRNPSNRREGSDQTHRNSQSHRDTDSSSRNSGNYRDSCDLSHGNRSSHREMSDHSESDSSSAHRNSGSQRYGHADKAYSSHQWRNGDGGSSQKKSPPCRDEYIEPDLEPEPEVELDGHQVRFLSVCPKTKGS